VSLNQQDTTKLLNGVEDEVAQASLGNWNLNVRDSRRVDCVVGVKNSLILSIIETEKTVCATNDLADEASETPALAFKIDYSCASISKEQLRDAFIQ